MKYLSLTLPGYGEVTAPKDVPTGGLSGQGENILQTMISAAFVLLIILALLTLIWGGLDWIMSRGDKGKVEAARLKITWAIGGLIVAFLSFLIVLMVGTFFGIDFFNTSQPYDPNLDLSPFG